MDNRSENTKAALIHLGGLCHYFFPLGNVIVPVVLWSVFKDGSPTLDNHGRRELNFQLSLIVYTIVLALIGIPVLVFGLLQHVPLEAFWSEAWFNFRNISVANLTGVTILVVVCLLTGLMMYVVSFFLVLIATVKAVDGQIYRYPGCITFLKYVPVTESAETSTITNHQGA